METKIELISINCCAADFFKFSNINHCFYNRVKVRIDKNAILGEILIQMSSDYTQIEEKNNILGGYD